MNPITIILSSLSSPLFADLLKRINSILPGSPVSAIYEALLPWSREDAIEMGINIPLVYEEGADDLYTPDDVGDCSWGQVKDLPSVKIQSVTETKVTLEVDPYFFNYLVMQEIALRNSADIVVEAPGRISRISEEALEVRQYAFGLHEMDYIHGTDAMVFRHRA